MIWAHIHTNDPIKEQYYQMNYFLCSYYLFKFKFYAKVFEKYVFIFTF